MLQIVKYSGLFKDMIETRTEEYLMLNLLMKFCLKVLQEDEQMKFFFTHLQRLTDCCNEK